MNPTPDSPCVMLGATMLDVGRQILTDEGGFMPFAGGLTVEGEVDIISGPQGDDVPDELKDMDPQDIIDELTEHLREGAEAGAYQAVGVALDASVTFDRGEAGEDAEAMDSDAIVIAAEQQGLAVRLVQPYKSADGEADEGESPLVFDEPMSLPSTCTIYDGDGLADEPVDE